MYSSFRIGDKMIKKKEYRWKKKNRVPLTTKNAREHAKYRLKRIFVKNSTKLQMFLSMKQMLPTERLSVSNHLYIRSVREYAKDLAIDIVDMYPVLCEKEYDKTTLVIKISDNCLCARSLFTGLSCPKYPITLSVKGPFPGAQQATHEFTSNVVATKFDHPFRNADLQD